jgi:hypothetical protein
MPNATVLVVVNGEPRRAQVVLYSETWVDNENLRASRLTREYAVRTASDGRATIGAVRPGAYKMTVQRQGRDTSSPRSVMIGPGRNQLVIGS